MVLGADTDTARVEEGRVRDRLLMMERAENERKRENELVPLKAVCLIKNVANDYRKINCTAC